MIWSRRFFGPLRVRTSVKSDKVDGVEARSPLTVVLLHGFGAPGDNLASFVERIDAPVDTTFILPEAPGMLDDIMLLNLVDDARVWWAKDARRLQLEVHGEAVPATRIYEALAQAREAVVTMVDAVEAETGASGDGIVLGGFSQGAMIAVDVALHTSRPLAGLIVLSGAMATDGDWMSLMSGRRELPVFQAHGTEDERPSFAAAEKLRDAMIEGGMRVTFSSFTAGHGIPPSVLQELGPWLGQLRGK